MKPYFETTGGQLFHGDSLDVLSGMDSESIQCCITSPPYWGLRDYGMDGQLGLEKTPEEYVSKMVEIFREVRRVLRNDGVLWLNLGDSYAGSNQGRGAKELSKKQHSNTGTQWMTGRTLPRLPVGCKPKDLCGIPWRVAFALQSDGWYLRQDIIWHKPNPMPESVTDRCTKSHEYIFLMSKSAKYYYNQEAIKEKSIDKESFTGRRARNAGQMNGLDPGNYKFHGSIDDNGKLRCGQVYETRNKRSVWTVPTKPYKEAHFATFPPALILPCILAGTAENDTILDPFAGSGTVWSMCEKYNRKSINIELSGEYSQLIKARITNETRQLKLFN